MDKLQKSQTSPVLGQHKYDEVVTYLQSPEDKTDPHLKHWVKKRNFQLMNLPGLGIDNTLVIPNKKKANGDGSSSFLKVVSTYKVYDIVQQVHSNELKHSGYKKVLDMVQKQYYSITRSYVQEFCTTCPT